MDECSLIFHGFSPSRITRSFLEEKMSALQDEAPYGAFLRAEFTNHEGDIIKGLVAIHSSAGRFFAVGHGPDLHDVTHKLIQRVRRQLDRWKSRRFRKSHKEGNHDHHVA